MLDNESVYLIKINKYVKTFYSDPWAVRVRFGAGKLCRILSTDDNKIAAEIRIYIFL